MTRNYLLKYAGVLVLILIVRTLVMGHCDLLIDDRNECGYPGIDRIECEDRNCCWIPFSPDDLRNPPWCSKRASNSCGYSLISSDNKNNKNLLLQDRCNSSRTARLSVEWIDEDILRVKIIRSDGEFQVPESIYPETIRRQEVNKKSLEFETFEDQNFNFNFKIYRSDTNETIWNTDLQNQTSSSSIRMKFLYTQVGSRLSLNHSIFGLGYHAGKLKIEPGSRLALFARDFPTIEGQNLYGSHPFYLQIQNNKAHGVYLRNSFGMDVVIEAEFIKFKALGGPIDLFFFSGPSALNVIEQYTKIIGKPAMFDYRILGFHQSRYGYKNISQISNVVDGFQKENIPLDTIWLDIDYMKDKKDFTIDIEKFPLDKLKQFTQILMDSHKRIVPILDPGIRIEEGYGPYERGLNQCIFIRNPNWLSEKDEFYVGQVWPGNVNFIDFTNPNNLNYWKVELQSFFELLPNGSKVIGGIWLDMNEPSNFIDGYNFTFNDMPSNFNSFSLNFPRYSINNDGNDAPIYRKTIPMDTRTALGNSYETHNLYGIFESIQTYKAILEINPKRRPFLLTRSTFPGSGQWTATWLGDNLSTFPQMALSIPGVLQYGLEGLPISGPDICGFMREASEELCARWMALGSFYPFSRNHNSIESTIDQEPFRWESVANVSRKYLSLRYSLLPFYYTLMHEAHVKGWPIWRPVFFYDDSSTATDINDQFFVGSHLLISPILEESATSICVRLPVGEWYDWETFNFIKSTLNPMNINYDAVLLDYIPIHLRAGSIIMMLEPKLTMFETRQTNFTMLIALDSSLSASGQIYWDDGVSLDVKDQYIDANINSRIEESTLNIDFQGILASIECPFIERIKVLTAGHKFMKKLKETDYGFDIEFEKALKIGNNFSIPLL